MQVTRRQFVMGSMASLGAAASPLMLSLAAATANAAAGADSVTHYTAGFSLLNRLSFGTTLAEHGKLTSSGLAKYLEAQLHPDDANDMECQRRIAKATLHIEYKMGIPKADDKKPGSIPTGGYPAINEDRPLSALSKPVEELWRLTDNSIPMDGKERNRPLLEVRTATWIRTIYSQWQLREVMVEFWHNHFNVAAGSQQQISATFPLYDAIMRRNCFGNFRVLLEEVAQSPAMLFYLNNAKSKEGPANENYARELFELHTIGADHYYNDLYNRWREVPGAVKGHPIGYIDQDVYEAARAFTGWTIEDGSNTGRGITFPKTGKFTYFDGWHDNYQKRVLGTEFDPNTPPMQDGQRVLDLVASHPGTAIHLSTKLCRRFICDNPPPELIKRVVKVWQQSVNKPDQIARVLRAIILSPEFANAPERKVKRPLEFVASFLRATGAEVTPNENLFGQLAGTGYKQFDWPSPTGHPESADYWLNTNSVLSSWNMISAIMGGGGKIATFDLVQQTPESVRKSGDIIMYWVMRLTGAPPDGDQFAALMQFMPKPHDIQFEPDRKSKDFKEPLQQLVTTIAMLPAFQARG